MTKIELKKEKTSKEMMEEGRGRGTITVGWNIINGTIGENYEHTFTVMLSGAKLYFSFSNGNRRVSLDLSPAVSDAYKLSME